MTHWTNPWEEAIPLDLDALDALLTPRFGHSMKEHWLEAGEKLDAYMLPVRSSDVSIGVRFGAEPHEYMSYSISANDLSKLKKLDGTPAW